jgi:hypothetical protein
MSEDTPSGDGVDVHAYVRLDHCKVYPGGRMVPVYKYLMLNGMEDDAGWLGLTPDGIVQFHGSGFLRGQCVSFRVPLTRVRDVVEGLPLMPLVMRAGSRAVRATLDKDRVILFDGLKTGVTKSDQMLGHIPHVGKLVEAGMLVKREGLRGASARGQEAAVAWGAILREEVSPGGMPVTHRWPVHENDAPLTE